MVYLKYLQANDGHIFAQDYLTEALIAKVFYVSTTKDDEVSKATDKDMTKDFGPSQGDRHYYQLSGM
ncbi:hypothetical protein, partial [Enterobacter cloacae complex sp. CH23B]|uniref:hypothetical protein n=1 Tax=Enterobacter cloacae complex sp. CH23B TaxID=2511986 RepID=UPI0010255F47